ncbi:hypothetical protein [Reinekea sp. G2M2-21]|uniref:hypothetical protein n=1 Tax=Reinekea sp. G2M2-21 TaxID=2788942 RepID=UPI0018A98264|nr:hypothetical protein [Reinekea sp. G2M2-21]
MLQKICPWCGKPVALMQVKKKPLKERYRWYELSQTVKVCPHCGEVVTLSSKWSNWMFAFMLPLFSIVWIDFLFGVALFDIPFVEAVCWFLVLVGIGGFYMFTKFEKP